MGSPDHYSDFVFIVPHIKFTSPVLSMHASPPSYGEVKGANTLRLVEEIRERSSAILESVFVEGTHHFHMIKPKETSDIILNFLNKIKSIESVVSKL